MMVNSPPPKINNEEGENSSSGQVPTKNQQKLLIIDQEVRSTAFNTNASPSEGAHYFDDDISVDLAQMDPIEGYEWRGVLFPEIDCLDLTAMQNGKEIKLRSYRWPPAVETERKAVVFMMHGYGSCCAQMAHIAKYLA